MCELCAAFYCMWCLQSINKTTLTLCKGSRSCVQRSDVGCLSLKALCHSHDQFITLNDFMNRVSKHVPTSGRLQLLWWGGGCLPWFFFQTAEEPGGELGADAGDLVCVWCWPWVSGGSRAAAGPARLGDRGRSEALFLRWSWGAASARCSGAWAGRVSWLEKKGGPRRGGAAESGWGTAAWKELSGLGIWKGSSWGLDTESNRGGFWSMATGVMFRLVAAAGRGGTGSVDFVLPRGTLEQVCRWVRRPR